MAQTVASIDVGGTGLSTVGTSGYFLQSNGTGLQYAAVTQTTFSAGTTGFTPNTATSGNVTLGGTLNVANGGTGVTSSTGTGSVVLNNNSTFTGTITMPSSVAGLTTPGFSTTNQGSNQCPIWLTRTTSQYSGISFRGVSTADYGLYNKSSDDSLYAGYWGGAGAWTDTLKLDTSKNATFYGLINANANINLTPSASSAASNYCVLWIGSGTSGGSGQIYTNSSITLNPSNGTVNATYIGGNSSTTPAVFTNQGGSTELGRLCRAYGYSNGSYSFNVSSVSNPSAGHYIFNFINAMPDTNYGVTAVGVDNPTTEIAVVRSNGGSGDPSSGRTTTAVYFWTFVTSSFTQTGSCEMAIYR